MDMKIIKKNWLYNINIAMGISIVVAGGLGFTSLLFLNDPILKGWMSNVFDVYYLYKRFYVISIVALSMYPIFAFKSICSQRGKEKIYLNTSNLPFSKKRLFWKGIKGWLMIFPIYLLVGVIIDLLSRGKIKTFGIAYLISFLQPIAIIIFGFAFQMQMISAIILVNGKRIKWYKVISGIIIGNIILTGLCMLGIEVLNIDTLTNLNWIIGIIEVFIIGSIVFLSTCWKYIEDMNR